MKMNEQLYSQLTELLGDFQAFHQVDFTTVFNKYKERGMSPKKFRWDVFWAAKPQEFIKKCYDSGLKDDHIDTALRKYFGHTR